MTTIQRQWLIPLAITKLTHKLGPTSSILTTQILKTYSINTASPALLNMLLRQKGSWHQKKNTSRELHNILNLCNLWTFLDSETETSSHIFILHPYSSLPKLNDTPLFFTFVYILTSRSEQTSLSYPLVRHVVHFVGPLYQLLLKRVSENHFEILKQIKRKLIIILES